MTADGLASHLPHPYLKPLSVRGRIARSQPKGLPLINLGFNELPFGPTPKVAEAIATHAARTNAYGAPGLTGCGRRWGRPTGWTRTR